MDVAMAALYGTFATGALELARQLRFSGEPLASKFR